MKIKIANGQIIGASTDFPQPTDIYIADTQIIAFGTKPDGFAEELLIDATHQIVCPGFIDLYSSIKPHDMDDMHRAVAGGFSTVTVQPDIDPQINHPAIVDWVKHDSQSTAGLELLPIAALSKNGPDGSLAPLGLLKAQGCVAAAVSKMKDTHLMRLCLDYAVNYDLPVFVTPQDPWFSEHGSVHEGEVSIQLGLAGMPICAETIEMYRYLALSKLTGAKIYFNKISTKEGVELIRVAKAQGLNVKATVSQYHLCFTDRNLLNFSTMFHLTPPLRSEQDKAALIAGVKDGTIDAIVSDYCAHTKDKHGLVNFSQGSLRGISYAVFLPFALGLTKLGWSWQEILEKVTKNPALFLGDRYSSAGTIALAQSANLCVFDPQKLWRFSDTTTLGIDVTPFKDWEFQGQVSYTINQGRVVFSSFFP